MRSILIDIYHRIVSNLRKLRFYDTRLLFNDHKNLSRSLIRKQMEEEEEEEEIFIPRNLTELEVNEYLNAMKTLKKVDIYFDLDVSNRNLTNVSVIPRFFGYLRSVNVSGNRLTSEALRVLERMDLVELMADQNYLISAELKPMKLLEKLTMNKNKLTYAGTSVISHKQLRTLELKDNLISTVEFKSAELPNLLSLELRGNALTTTAGIHSSTLKNLFLANNQIEKIETLRELPNLTTLHLQSNQLTNLNGFSKQCLKLNYINLSDNKISNVSEFAKLSCLRCLQTLIILENPFLKKIREDEEGKRYRRIVLMMLPNLITIDKFPVETQEKDQAKELLNETRAKGYGFTDYDLANFDF